MSEPNDSILPQGVQLNHLVDGQIELSQSLVDLLLAARREYVWKAHTARESQQTIINLEVDVAAFMNPLDVASAHEICMRVSKWAGNRAKAHAAIVNATASDKLKMLNSLQLLNDPDRLNAGLDSLSDLPGISLVIASKIYRFCCPQAAAAVDRHASYFFNSLDVIPRHQAQAKAIHFKREWSTARHTNSRLATFTPSNYLYNRKVFVEVYLRLLACIAAELNTIPAQYTCAASRELKTWRPTDVEMAAYYWWATNGAR